MDKGPHPWKVAGVKRLLALAKPSWGSCSTLVHSHLYTFPYIYGVGSRLSSTAVYPPCPPTICENLDGCPSGHGGYTATGYAMRLAALMFTLAFATSCTQSKGRSGVATAERDRIASIAKRAVAANDTWADRATYEVRRN